MNSTVSANRVYVLMGVSGSGKSAVAAEITCQLHTAFLDGDFLHPRHNIEKMAAGQPLDDEDRAPWLRAINDAAFAMQRTNRLSLIVCSALKKAYRDQLRANNPYLAFIWLKGDFAVIKQRLKKRPAHFFRAEMLLTQFETLEEPGPDEKDVFVIDANQPLRSVVADTIACIRRRR